MVPSHPLIHFRASPYLYKEINIFIIFYLSYQSFLDLFLTFDINDKPHSTICPFVIDGNTPSPHVIMLLSFLSTPLTSMENGTFWGYSPLIHTSFLALNTSPSYLLFSLVLFCGDSILFLFMLSRMYMLFGFLVVVATNHPEYDSMISHVWELNMRLYP